NVTLARLTADLVGAFRRLNGLLLPVPYPDKFYDEAVTDRVAGAVTIVALWWDGGPPGKEGAETGGSHGPGQPPASPATGSTGTIPPPTLYISTLAVLAPFRHLGLAAHLVAAATVRGAALFGCRHVAAHVWAANEEARAWYRRRGFGEEGRDEAYYARLRPKAAVCVRK
ncbi:hypothetical protein BDY21DRAFT_272289, partial [Lineolata rhizophorae]